MAAGVLLRQEVAQRHAGARRRPHQLAGIGVLRRGENLARRRGLDHVALLHHHDAVAIGGGEAEIVGDQDGRHAALARQLDHEVHHGLLGGDVEAGGRLVGDQELRPAGERERDHHALAHAARQLERIGVVALARPRDAHLVERPRSPARPASPNRPARAASSTSSICWPTLRIGLSAARGFWKIIDISRPRRLRMSSSLASRTSRPVNMHRAFGDPAGAVEDAHHRIGGDRLARAGFADDADASRPWRR